MNTIRIRKRLDSDTVHVPELHAWVGSDVEIIVLSEPHLDPGNPNLSTFFDVAGTIDVDDTTVDAFREASKL